MDQSRSSRVTVELIPRGEWESRLAEMARLRISVFREYPYLYDGTEAYESKYLKTYFEASEAGIVGAFDGEKLVGVSTVLPLAEADLEFRDPLVERGYPVQETFYFGESVLLPEYRGKGVGGKFFDLRELHARSTCPSLRFTSFCAVDRPLNDSRRPSEYRSLDSFWQSRGYQKAPSIQAHFDWKEIGSEHESNHALTYWIKDWNL